MGDKNKKDTLVKRLIKQIAGNLTEEDELIPEVAIIGSGKIWCWDPMNKTPRRICRGIKAYILYENYDHQGRTLIYTLNAEMVCIEPEELLYTGYD
mgnify:CR=1 FL=1|tara:strand:- start:759 stop:1046 length:288 start_codon:yes stop_codon:yes gene_type:complete